MQKQKQEKVLLKCIVKDCNGRIATLVRFNKNINER